MKSCYRFVIFGLGKLRKRSLKVLEKSWNLFVLMVYEPCTYWIVNVFELENGHKLQLNSPNISNIKQELT